MDDVIVVSAVTAEIKLVVVPQETAVDTVAELNSACRSIVLSYLSAQSGGQTECLMSSKQLACLIDSMFGELFSYCYGPKLSNFALKRDFRDLLGNEHSIVFSFERVENLSLHCA